MDNWKILDRLFSPLDEDIVREYLIDLLGDNRANKLMEDYDG